MSGVSSSQLGKPTEYPSRYTPSLLHSIRRDEGRQPLGVADPLPFRGEDVWVGYEFSWLNNQGKPEIAGIRLHVPCQSPCVIESKSLKLYLNSFGMERFAHRMDVLRTLDKDLSLAARAPVMVELLSINQFAAPSTEIAGTCLDDLDVRVDQYEPDAGLLGLEGNSHELHETMYTSLFRSLCPVTGQPDWATVIVEYQGAPIHREGLLKYLISYRDHPDFHEACIEQIFMDIKLTCRPRDLTVHGRFLRRGGLEINPYRSDKDEPAPLVRLSRQ